MNNRKLLLHPATQRALGLYLKAPAQVVAVIGQPGSGKSSVALNLAAALLGDQDTTKLINQARMVVIEKQTDKQDISIDSVRDLIRNLRVKQPGEGQRRVILISGAHNLSVEAQNALLKTLEQPNPDAYFILTVDSPSLVLPTIMSRAQKITVQPVTSAEAQKFYSRGHSPTQIHGAWALSEGAAGSLYQLLEDGEEQPLKEAVDTAKKFLTMTTFQRLVEVDRLSKDKQQSAALLLGLARVLKALHHAAVRNRHATNAAKLLDARNRVEQASEYLQSNASPKLTLLRLALSLKL